MSETTEPVLKGPKSRRVPLRLWPELYTVAEALTDEDLPWLFFEDPTAEFKPSSVNQAINELTFLGAVAVLRKLQDESYDLSGGYPNMERHKRMAVFLLANPEVQKVKINEEGEVEEAVTDPPDHVERVFESRRGGLSRDTVFRELADGERQLAAIHRAKMALGKVVFGEGYDPEENFVE